MLLKQFRELTFYQEPCSMFEFNLSSSVNDSQLCCGLHTEDKYGMRGRKNNK